jgi:hypothetical protein
MKSTSTLLKKIEKMTLGVHRNLTGLRINPQDTSEIKKIALRNKSHAHNNATSLVPVVSCAATSSTVGGAFQLRGRRG